MSQRISEAELQVEELESAVLQLPREARARLAGVLLYSLDEDAEYDRAWEAEIRKRIAAYKAGEMKSRPIEDVMQEIDDLLK